jgi:nucleoside-diphosphate-sugar epimerase
MDVVVAGGHGKIGLRLLRLLAEDGHRARGIIRKQEQVPDLEEAGGEAIVIDIEAVEASELASAIGSADAVVFAAGAGPGSGEERKRTMDYGGAVKLIEAAKQNGISRYVMVSSIGADAPEATGAEGTFLVYLQAKHDADQELVASGLDYTIVRPHGLTDDPGTGRVEVGDKMERGEVPRDDVAAVLRRSLEAENTVGKIFEVKSGDTPIDEAVASV